MNQLLQRGGGILRHTARRAERLGRAGASQANGLVQRVIHLRSSPKDLDDVTLARKVETEIFRPADAPKGKIDVNAVDGVVWLRGEVKRPQEIKGIEARVRAIPEVKDVENLLHLPKTPAKSRTRAGAKGRSKSPTRITRNVNAEETGTAAAEPTPAEKAATGAGREAAPMGSQETGGTEGGRTP